MAVKETKEHVFIELLQAWRESEDSIIGEGLDSRPDATEKANLEMLNYLDRYAAAPSEPVMISIFKQCVIDAMMDTREYPNIH